MSARELPDFLKRGWPEGPAPREYPRPGRMRFPEARREPEPSGYDGARVAEVAAWEWLNCMRVNLD